MGRLIDANSVYNAIQIKTDNFGVAKHVVETNMLDMLAEIPTVEAISKDQYEALKQHLFKLSYSIDSHSSSKDYAALRNTHYENQNWIKENGLQDEYYNYFF